MQDDDGQTSPVHSVSAGLDYPGVGPEHSFWKDAGRVRYTSCRDEDALRAFDALAAAEGILPALESSHAVAKAMELAKGRPKTEVDRRLPQRPRRQGRQRNRPAQGSEVRLMNSIDQLFAKLRSEKRKALMPFVTAGDPDLAFTAAVLKELVAHGASLCEVGVPYSDPIADGPVIQASYTRALDKGVKLCGILKMLAETAPTLAAPVVTMVSYAIVYRHGVERYCDEVRAAGVAGLIVPDLPVEESPQLAAVCGQRESEPCPARDAHDSARPRDSDLRDVERVCVLRVRRRHHGRANATAAGGGRQRRLAPRADGPADLHRLRHQPAGARAAAGPGGGRTDRGLGDRPPHGRRRRSRDKVLAEIGDYVASLVAALGEG